MQESVGEMAGGLSGRGVGACSKAPRSAGICVSDEPSPGGSRQRITELYKLLRPSLRGYLCSLGVSQHDSEDIIQETFLRLVRHLVQYRSDENLRGWAFRVARNISVDFYRSERRRFRSTEPHPSLRSRADPAPNPEQRIIFEERVKRFTDGCAQLTPKQRHCVLLRARGLRYREIALILGVSVQRVGELMQCAISALQ